MMYKIGDGIISPLGATTEDNYLAVRSGLTGIRQFPAGFRDLKEPILASLISPVELEELATPYCVAVKPTPTVGGKGRHDTCFALRVPVVVEAVTALVLADLSRAVL
jgi:chorismate synthase